MMYIVHYTTVLCCLLAAVNGQRKCRAGQAAVQTLSRPLESNGCTKPDFLTVQGEEDFTYCCDRHDVCFSTCGLTQTFCDEDFKRCMHNLCDKVFPHNSECRSAASTYSMGTALFGVDAFRNGQEDHCECIDSNGVIDHYKAYAKQFYDKFVPQESAKDPSDIFTEKSKYLKNSGSESSPQYRSIYRSVYDLHRKYDNAIGHIGARKSKRAADVPKPPKLAKEL